MGSRLACLLLRVWVLFAVCWVLSASVSAAVPHLVRYQGQAVDSQGVPLQGPYTLTFRLYDADTAGTIVWQEQQANVPLNKGHFSVLLGQVTALTVNWSQSLWLSIQVGTDPELLPRQRITSVPLAIRSEVAEGLVTQITTSTITDDANKLVPLGAIILWNGAACPSGYTRLSSYDGRFLRAAPTAGGGGGSDTVTLSVSQLPAHTHPVSHTHTTPNHTHPLSPANFTGFETVESGAFGPAGGDFKFYSSPTIPPSGAGITDDANPSISGTAGNGAPIDIRPAYKEVILCQKD